MIFLGLQNPKKSAYLAEARGSFAISKGITSGIIDRTVSGTVDLNSNLIIFPIMGLLLPIFYLFYACQLEN